LRRALPEQGASLFFLAEVRHVGGFYAAPALQLFRGIAASPTIAD
jgi:hypothetical protein